MSDELLFLDTASHYATGSLPANPASAKWSRADGINYGLSGRAGAVAGERCVTLGSLSGMYRFVTPQTKMCFGAALNVQALGGGLSFQTENALYAMGITPGGAVQVQRFSGDPPLTNVDVKVFVNGGLVLTGTIVPGGSGALVGPSAPILTAGEWWYVEFFAEILGNQQLFHSFHLNPVGGGFGMAATAFYVTNGVNLGNPLLLGTFTPARLRTNGDGAITQGVPSTPGPHYLMTTEQPPDDPAPDNTGTFVSLVSIGDTEFHQIEDISGTPTILAVQGVWHVGKSASGAAAYQAILRNAAGVEYVCPVFPGTSDVDRYPSYTPSGYDFSKMETAPFPLSPFTGLAWTVAEVNGVQMGLRKVAPEAPGSGTVTFSAGFEGSPTAGWTSAQFNSTPNGRHLKGGVDGGHLNVVNISGAGTTPFISMGAAQLWNGSNDLGLTLSNTNPGAINTVLGVTQGGLLFLFQSAFGQQGIGSPFFAERFCSDEHWYFLELLSGIVGSSVVDLGGDNWRISITVESGARLNGQSVLALSSSWSIVVHSVVPPTPPPINMAGVSTPGGGQSSITDDVYVAFDDYVGDSEVGTPSPDPEIIVTQMTLEVVQGVAITPPLLTLACPVANTGAIGVPYSSSLQASGGVPPYTFALLPGGTGLPPGLNLNTSTGQISGVPTANGLFTYTAQVTDSVAQTAQVTCSINIPTGGGGGGGHVGCIEIGAGQDDDIYIVRDYKFVNERMPSDVVFFTPWSNLGWPYEKTARNLILSIDTGGVPCAIDVQADGQTVQTVSVSSKSNDRNRKVALNPNMIGKSWRLVLTQGLGGKAQLFAAALDHIREPGGVLFYDSLEQNFGFVGFKVMKQAWISYRSAADLTVMFIVDGGGVLHTQTLPARSYRAIERFFLPVSNGSILGKTNKIRIRITSSSPLYLYADSIVEFIAIGQEQRQSFSLTSVHPEQMQPVSNPILGQWSEFKSVEN